MGYIVAVKKLTKQPDWVCEECGKRWGRYVCDIDAEFHKGQCDICGSTSKLVTNPHNFAAMLEGWQKTQ